MQQPPTWCFGPWDVTKELPSHYQSYMQTWQSQAISNEQLENRIKLVGHEAAKHIEKGKTLYLSRFDGGGYKLIEQWQGTKAT